MSGLQYVGRTPDSDSSVINKSYADALDDTLVVTTDYVNSVISTKATPLTTPAYVDQQDLLRAKKLSVDIMDENYVPLTELGQANGVATTDNYGSITTAQIPSSAVTNRTSLYYEASSQGVVYMAPDEAHSTPQLPFTHPVISTSNTREFRLASIYVTDPGYPWYPLAFAWVLGKSGGTDPGQGHTNTNVGQLVVQPPQGVSDSIYASAICLSSMKYNFHNVLPSGGVASPPVTPLNFPAVTGPLQLDLYGSCYTGSSYIWSGVGLVYYILVFPAF